MERQSYKTVYIAFIWHGVLIALSMKYNIEKRPHTQDVRPLFLRFPRE